MADPTDNVELALEDLENEPLPKSTRDRAREPEDEIEIEHVEDGEPAAPAPEAPPQRPPEPREIPAGEGIEALRARLQASDIARAQAEQRAQIAEQQRVQAAGATQDADVRFLDTALQGLRQGMAVLKANLAEAYSVQDFSAVADLQVEISRAAQRESQIEAGLESLKAMPKPQAAPPPQLPSVEQQVEQVASQLTPKAAAWVRAHPQYVTDHSLNQQLVGAHNLAVGRGFTAETPEYMQFVERTLGLEDAPSSSSRPGFVEERTPVADTRPKAPPAAPVSRANGGGNNPTRVTLTREQREIAHENFPEEMEADPSGLKAERAYARNMLVLKREGRLN